MENSYKPDYVYPVVPAESNLLDLENFQQLRIRDIFEIYDFFLEKVRDRKKISK